MSEKNISQNKTFWVIGLICMITISLNNCIIIPLGLFVLLVALVFKKDYQVMIKANLEKVIIAILIGSILGLFGVGPRLSIYGGKTEEGGYKAGFNFSLFQVSLPSFLISKDPSSVDNIEPTNTSSKESPLQKYQNVAKSEFTGGFEGCQLVMDEFTIAWNAKSSSGFRASINSQSGVTEQDQIKIIKLFLGARETFGPMTGLIMNAQKSYFIDNTKIVIITYMGDFDTARNIPIGIQCQYNNEKDKREWSSWKAGDDVRNMIQ